jgi:hypothetical protein
MIVPVLVVDRINIVSVCLSVHFEVTRSGLDLNGNQFASRIPVFNGLYLRIYSHVDNGLAAKDPAELVEGYDRFLWTV